MRLFQEATEKRAQSGIGSNLFYKDVTAGDTKFHLLLLATKIPSAKGDKEKIDVGTTSSTKKGQLEGLDTLNTVEVEVYHHRDNAKRFEKLKGKQLEFLAFDNDLFGERYTGSIDYKSGDRSSGDATMGTVTITPSDYFGNVDDVTPLIQKTAMFKTEIPAIVSIPVETKKFEMQVTMDPVDGTFTATSSATGIATVTATAGKLTITGVAKGTAVITLKSSGTDMASWETNILVEVPELTV